MYVFGGCRVVFVYLPSFGRDMSVRIREKERESMFLHEPLCESL